MGRMRSMKILEDIVGDFHLSPPIRIMNIEYILSVIISHHDHIVPFS